MTWGDMHALPKEFASVTALRETEARLTRRVNELEAMVETLRVQFSALTLNVTCHPEWVRPLDGPAAHARRGNIVESILQMAGNSGMSVPILAAYLHVPNDRYDVLSADLLYLNEQERITRVGVGRAVWRIKGASHGRAKSKSR